MERELLLNKIALIAIGQKLSEAQKCIAGFHVMFVVVFQNKKLLILLKFQFYEMYNNTF